jgi:hypothetical protein
MKIRDIGIYDEDNLLVIIRNALSYSDAIKRFKKEHPKHPAHSWSSGYSARNMNSTNSGK